MTFRSLSSRSLVLAMSLLAAGASSAAAQRQAAPGSARATAQRTLNAFAQRNAEAFAREVSPEDLAGFRTQLLPQLKTALSGQQREQALAMIAPARSYEEAEKLPAERLYAIYMGAVMKRVATAGSVTITNTILGEVPEGDSLVHVVYRQHFRQGANDAASVKVLSLRRTPGGWKVKLDQPGLAAQPGR